MSQKIVQNPVINLLQEIPKPLFFKDKKLALFWSAKAGCTFAIKWFFFQIGCLEAASFYHKWIHKYRQEVFYESQGYKLHIQDILKPDTNIIKFVRNPYARVVSSYIHAINTGYEDKRISVFLNRVIDQDNGFSFIEFIDYLESIDLRNCNGHHKIQVHISEAEKLVNINYIIRLENSFEELKKIEFQLGLKSSNLTELSSSHHHSIRDRDNSFCGDRRFCVSKLNKNRYFPKSPCFYNEDLKNRVNKLYELDFNTYQYDPYILPER
ncbi:MAG: hypothetical protein D6711_10295 [Chloroflexi bacterium]|nr:MAG: hypothetical protein D6711_10295 [Chloroflexota bacterium]